MSFVPLDVEKLLSFSEMLYRIAVLLRQLVHHKCCADHRYNKAYPQKQRDINTYLTHFIPSWWLLGYCTSFSCISCLFWEKMQGSFIFTQSLFFQILNVDVYLLGCNARWTCSSDTSVLEEHADDRGSMFLANVGIQLQFHTAVLPKRPTSTCSQPLELQASSV